MMRGLIRRLAHDVRAAVAPTVALSLFGLIAAGGIAFDYARVATMDTELQDAADQAALAAATQLDRTAAAQTHARAAIQDADKTSRLASNLTKFANDSDGLTVEIESITFCSAFDDSKPDNATACAETTSGADSRFVIVTTSARTANFAFTPIVAALSGTVTATAVAGVESSICNIAPLFVCTNNAAFPTDDDVGDGLVMKTGAQNSWFPGNYGYLDFGPGNPGVIDALLGNGLNGCLPIDESNTQPGNKNATDAINTRFDVYAGTGSTKDPSICTVDGKGCPDENTGKDMTLQMTYKITQKTTLPPPTPPNCGETATDKNANPATTYDKFALNTAAQGFPRDDCHYSSCTGGSFGNGTWNRDAYMAANHGTITAADVATDIGNGKTAATLTRYDVYKWEIAHKNDTPGKLDPFEVGTTQQSPPKVQGTNTTYTFTKQCMFRQPERAKDKGEPGRRVLPVVAADCADLNGVGSLDAFHAIRVFDVFLTEPSITRAAPGIGTDEKEIYGEIMGPAQTIEGGTGFQYYSRNKPFLVR